MYHQQICLNLLIIVGTVMAGDKFIPLKNNGRSEGLLYVITEEASKGYFPKDVQFQQHYQGAGKLLNSGGFPNENNGNYQSGKYIESNWKGYRGRSVYGSRDHFGKTESRKGGTIRGDTSAVFIGTESDIRDLMKRARFLGNIVQDKIKSGNGKYGNIVISGLDESDEGVKSGIGELPGTTGSKNGKYSERTTGNVGGHFQGGQGRAELGNYKEILGRKSERKTQGYITYYWR